MKFRKKPIEVEAEQFKLGQEPYPKDVIPVWVDSNRPEIILALVTEQEEVKGANIAFGIKTLEGWHIVTHGDWIITGIAGEKYPCKLDIFEKTYEPVSESKEDHYKSLIESGLSDYEARETVWADIPK